MYPQDYRISTLNEYLQRLEHYVNCDSPSGCKNEMDRMSAGLIDEFKAVGCSVTAHDKPNGKLLECRLGSGSRQILMLGHMDTVFPLGTASARPFTRKGDKLYGPGVLDMKSGVLMILEIMRHFAGQLPDDVSLCALLNCDEEIGSADSRDLIMSEGRKSIACLCMEPSKPNFCTVARKGLVTFTVEVNGVAAHSGVNYHLGRSAIQGICNIVNRLYTMRDDERGISVNIGGIQGGAGKGNIVAESASLIGEVRYYQPELAEGILEKLNAYCSETGIEGTESIFNIQAHRPPMQQSDASRALYELARKAAERNGLELVGRTHGGGSDGSYVSYVGTPVVDGMGAEGEFSHTTEEYVKVDTLIARMKTCIDLIASIISN